MDCLFCKIIAGKIPSKEIFRDDEVLAIADIDPQAPTHILVMPRKHYGQIAEVFDAGGAPLAAKLLSVATRLGQKSGADGFRLVINTGELGGQTVDHVHVHVLSGRHMTWPPG